MMKQIEMVSECISSCDEIILFGHRYKSNSSWGAQDQFDDVTSLIKYYKPLPVLLILYHTILISNSINLSFVKFFYFVIKFYKNPYFLLFLKFYTDLIMW